MAGMMYIPESKNQKCFKYCFAKANTLGEIFTLILKYISYLL